MITPTERVVQAVEEHFMVLHNVLPDVAFGAVTDTLDELQTSLGYCPECWGRGFALMQPTDQNASIPYCYCERGKILEKIVNANLLTHRPK